MKTKFFMLLLATAILIPCREAFSEINPKTRDSSNLIKTFVPIVYKKGSEFYVLDGLDTLRKSEVWGFSLKCGVFIKKTMGGAGRWQDVETMNWFDCKVFAESMAFNGKPGRLPSKELLKKHKGEEKEAVNKTVEILNRNGIEAFEYEGLCWCREEKEDSPGFAYRFSLNIWEYVADKYNTEEDYRRIIVDFSGI